MYYTVHTYTTTNACTYLPHHLKNHILRLCKLANLPQLLVNSAAAEKPIFWFRVSRPSRHSDSKSDISGVLTHIICTRHELPHDSYTYRYHTVYICLTMSHQYIPLYSPQHSPSRYFNASSRHADTIHAHMINPQRSNLSNCHPDPGNDDQTHVDSKPSRNLCLQHLCSR